MAIPKPTDLTCRHQAAWAYITVPTKRGHSQVVEYYDRGDWYQAAQMGAEWLVPMHQHADTDFRARYTRAGEHSAWTTGRVWMPDGFEYDGSTPVRPEAPYRLRNRWPASGEVHLSWSQDGDVDGWRVVVVQDGQIRFEHVVSTADVEVGGLAYDQGIDVTITAVVGEAESEALTQTYPDFGYRPATPRDLTVVPTDTTLDLSWLQDDFCEEWQVLWRPADAGVLRRTDEVPEGTRGETGNVVVSGDAEYTVTGLAPGTAYSLLIAARWRRSSYSVESLTAVHATTGGGAGPRTPQLRQGRVTATSIEVLWDDDEAATGWVVRRSPGHSRHRPTGVPRWFADGLASETAYEFGVIAVDDDHGLESDEATIVITTGGDVPPPPGPSVPRGLRVHCIHATHAKAEWDGNPVEEDVKYYQVRLTGASSSARDVVGTLQELTDLIPESDYTIEVRACNDTGCSGWASHPFTTGSTAPPPEPDPPSGVPAPTGLYLDPVAPGEVHASWDRPADERTWWIVAVNGRDWQRVTEPTAHLTTEPGVEALVEVYALLNNSQGNAVKLSAITSAGVVTARKGA